MDEINSDNEFYLYFMVNRLNKQLWINCDINDTFEVIYNELIKKYEWLSDLFKETNGCFQFNGTNIDMKKKPSELNISCGAHLDLVEDKNDISLSTFTDWKDSNLENSLEQSFARLDKIIGATKKIRQERQTIEKESDNNSTVVHTGTDYHGDITYFMNGAVSEIVEWDENTINVVDVRDGEILFSGTKHEIKNNIGTIKQKLENKYDERQKKLRKLIYDLVYPQACDLMKSSGLNFDPQEGLIGFNGVEILFNNEQQAQELNVSFNFRQLIDDTLTNLGNLDQFDLDNIVDTIKSAMSNQISAQCNNWNTWYDGNATDCFVNCWSSALSKVLLSDVFQKDLDLWLKKDFKVVLTHDCKIKEDLNPEKDLVRLTGDYIDRGDSSCEILCHIKNIHDKITEKANEEKKPELKKCFVTTIGNHEVGYVPNSYNDKCANALCKTMIAKSYLVSGDMIESKDNGNKNCKFSFSHTVMFKGSYPLILKQILELSELENEMNPDKVNNSTNQIVVWIKSIFSDDNGVTINNIGMEILNRILKRYKKVIADEKYKDLFKKFTENKEEIRSTLTSCIPNFSKDDLLTLGEGIFKTGNKIYEALKDNFQEAAYLLLKYLAMDVFCYPVVSDFDDKMEFFKNAQVFPANNLYWLSCICNLTFSEIGTTLNYPPCFMSVTNIAFNDQLSKKAPNNFTWEKSSIENSVPANDQNKDVSQYQHEIDDIDKRYFEKKWPENIIQVHGHERRNDHSYLSQPGEVNGDITGSIGYNGAESHKKEPDYKCTLIGTAHINLNDHTKSSTEVLQYNHLKNEVKIMNDNNKQQTKKLPLLTSPNDGYFKNMPTLEQACNTLKQPGNSNLNNQNDINNMNNNIINIDNENNINNYSQIEEYQKEENMDDNANNSLMETQMVLHNNLNLNIALNQNNNDSNNDENNQLNTKQMMINQANINLFNDINNKRFDSSDVNNQGNNNYNMNNINNNFPNNMNNNNNFNQNINNNNFNQNINNNNYGQDIINGQGNNINNLNYRQNIINTQKEALKSLKEFTSNFSSSKTQNKKKKSNWLIKILILLTIIFAALSILAFALEFALALKIIFVCVTVICFIGSILSKFVNRCKKENLTSENFNVYDPTLENNANAIENIQNQDRAAPGQYQNTYQNQYQNP